MPTHPSEQLDAIDTALDRMDRIIEDVLLLAREGRDIGPTERIDLAEAVETAWSIVADNNDSAALVGPDPGADRLGCIDGDGDRLQRLFENVFRNAIEHGGAAVTVTLGRLDDGFYIEDDGPGIPEGKRERVFEAGHSTVADGTGFGLNIVQRIVEAHGWEISVTDGSTGGARFEITGVEFAPE